MHGSEGGESQEALSYPYNVQNLRDNYLKLISHMETNGYSKTYVDSFKREIKKILASEDSEEWSCYLCCDRP